MFEFIRQNQMDIMLFFCAVCTAMAAMLFITRFLPSRRRWILITMEVIATLLLFFDRLAYIYAGRTSAAGYIMVRLSNFMVFFITGGIVFIFNLYITDLLTREGKLSVLPRRLSFVSIAAVVEMLLVILNVFTGFYYYFDTVNRYHRGIGFLFSYLVPVTCPIVQFSVIHKYRNRFSHLIYTALFLYIFVPIVMGIIQIFAYGISIVNMAMVLVSVSLYFFTYLDINAEVEKAHTLEIQLLKSEQQGLKNLFGQTAKAFANAFEKQGIFSRGHAERRAALARSIAEKAGKSEQECDKIYYAAFLLDAGADSLDYIKAYPFLSETARYQSMRYDGNDGSTLKGEAIPEYARIIAVAKAYEELLSNKALPLFFMREEFIREAGAKFDPTFAQIAVHMLDAAKNSGTVTETYQPPVRELEIIAYRERVTAGIPILQTVKEISFDCTSLDNTQPFSAPSLILFDSFDAQVHQSPEAIETYSYLEYGEIWFDAHTIVTNAKNMEMRNIANTAKSTEDTAGTNATDTYHITCSRADDHLLLRLSGSNKSFEVIVALPSTSKAAYIALTGENARLTNITVTETGAETAASDIPRIAEKVDYTDRIESDIPNVQINGPQAAFTEGVEVKDKMKLFFHTQSLPEANLVWHCPYIVLYDSDDHTVHGKNYHEYALIKLDGEDNGSYNYAQNNFTMKKTENFKSWADWKSQNKAGYECQIDFFKDKDCITIRTSNKGIAVENTTKILDGTKALYVTLTGDQCALTDIRVR